MRRKQIGMLLSMILLATIPFTTGAAMASSPVEEPQSLIGVTFIAGYILKPEISERNIVTAKAVLLFYYDRGLIIKDSGIVTGLKNIRFRNTPLMLISEPDAIGGVMAIGVCTGFHIMR
ncbi:MAG TPA: hypothetical protein ENI44_03580 [Thermoplasmatales archaeon]|nr:hypothetical protein [Thermoplasmatales archaeon]